MAITKEVNIVVKETGLDEVNKKVNKLETSVSSLEDKQKSLANSMGDSSQSVLDNGGAMGLLNDATGGLAMTVKDAVEASVLFTKSQKAAAIVTAIQTTVIGTSTGAMKAFRIALAATGIGLIVIGIGLLIANFDKVKKVVMNLIPGLSIVGDIFTSLVEMVTDFVGITSDASRELDRLGAQAEKTLAKNKFALDAYGDTYDQYTKRKIESNNKYAEHVKAINEDETLNEAEKLKRLKILRETADREILKAEDDRQTELTKKRKDAEDKAKAESDKQKEDAKKSREDALKAEEDAQKRREEKVKEDAQKAYEIDQEAKQAMADITEFKNAEIEKREDKEIASGETKMSLIQGEYDAEKQAAENRIFLDEEVKNAKVDIAMQTLSLIAEIAGQGSKVAKAVAITQATISGVQGVQNAFTTASASPVTAVFPAYPFIQAGLAGAFSAVQIAKIAKGDKASGGSSSSGGGSSPQAPSFNLIQGTGRNQIAEGLNRQTVVKAYVVPTDVSTGQSMDRNIVKSASL